MAQADRADWSEKMSHVGATISGMAIVEPSEHDVAQHCALLSAAIRANPDTTFLRIGHSDSLHAVHWTRLAGRWDVPSPRCGHAPAHYEVLSVSAVKAVDATCSDCLSSIRAGARLSQTSSVPTQLTLFDLPATVL
jgi:hypothetical protein